MKSVFRATAILSGSSMISMLLGLVASRIMAGVLHPVGYGYYGLLQSFVAVSSLLVSMGMATGLVRLGAASAASGDQDAIGTLSTGAWLMMAVVATPALIALFVFRVQISRWTLGTPDRSGAILLMGIALTFGVAINIQNGILNAWHKVESLAAWGVINSTLNAAIGITSVVLWQEKGIVPAVVASAFTGWLASRILLLRGVPRRKVRVPFREALRSARSLFAFGVPFTASVAVGNGIQLAMPMVVVHLLSTEGVGYYKASAAIAVGYLGFLITAMTQDYYPRVSAVRDQPQALASVINEQHRLVLLLAVPVILLTLSLVPWIVPLVYTRRFMPAVAILEWQLIGDIFRFSAWTVSFAILARCKPSIYFLSELISGVVTVFCTWFAVHLWGLAGLGIGFVIAFVVYYVTVWLILRRELHSVWAPANRGLMLAALVAALVIRIVPSTPLAPYRLVIALALVLAFGAWSVRALWGEYIAPRVRKTLHVGKEATHA
jgi:PST family polysaccharide transporter